MGKYATTISVIVLVMVTIVSSFVQDVGNAMINLIIQIGWCSKDNLTCHWLYRALAGCLFIGVAVIIDFIRNNIDDWRDVDFSSWSPLAVNYQVLGGIKIRNRKDQELEECVAELLSYYEDYQIEHNFAGAIPYFQEGHLPLKLHWYVDKEYKTAETIGRGKDGYVIIASPLSKDEEEMVVGKVSVYAIRGVGLTFHHPVDTGYLELRISAKSLKPIVKVVRVDIKEGILSLQIVSNRKEIRKVQSINKIPKTNRNEQKKAITKEDFLKVLKKATHSIQQKTSRGKRKSKA